MELGDGTWIGGGIATALYHLQKSNAERKIIILLTDGVSNFKEISSNSSIEIAKSMNVSIYSLGVGTKNESIFEVKDPKTGVNYFGKSSGIFDDKLLKEISNQTGGRYFTISNISIFEKIFDFINVNESINNSFKIEVSKDYVYKYFIVGAILLCLFSFFIKEIILKAVLW